MFRPKNNGDLVEEDQRKKYFRFIGFKKQFIILMLIVAVASAIISLGIGSYHIGFSETLQIVYDYLAKGPSGSLEERVVWELRIPRGLMGVIVGACLAVGGCVMQNMLRNPLADPYITGVSSGASLGAAISMVLGISILPFATGVTSVITNAFLISLIPAFFILTLSAVKKVTSTTMILIGIGVMYMFAALTQMLKLIATPTQMEQLYRWQLGTLSDAGMDTVLIVLVSTVVCISILYMFRNHLNIISLGDNLAVTMGTDPWKVRIICLIIVSFMTAVCVSFTGTIGFVGLVAPQIVRVFIGSDNRYLMPASAFFGAAFLVLCDSVSRVVGMEGVPVGVVTAIIGSPLFLYLLVMRARRTSV